MHIKQVRIDIEVIAGVDSSIIPWKNSRSSRTDHQTRLKDAAESSPLFRLLDRPPFLFVRQLHPNHTLAATTMESTPGSSEYVTLVSGDGFEFIVPRSTACVSGTIRRMLDPSSTRLFSFSPSFALSSFKTTLLIILSR